MPDRHKPPTRNQQLREGIHATFLMSSCTEGLFFFFLFHVCTSSLSNPLPRGMRYRRLQILPQTARARNIPILHRFFRRNRSLGSLVMNERTSRHVKDF